MAEEENKTKGLNEAQKIELATTINAIAKMINEVAKLPRSTNANKKVITERLLDIDTGLSSIRASVNTIGFGEKAQATDPVLVKEFAKIEASRDAALVSLQSILGAIDKDDNVVRYTANTESTGGITATVVENADPVPAYRAYVRGESDDPSDRVSADTLRDIVDVKPTDVKLIETVPSITAMKNDPSIADMVESSHANRSGAVTHIRSISNIVAQRHIRVITPPRFIIINKWHMESKLLTRFVPTMWFDRMGTIVRLLDKAGIPQRLLAEKLGSDAFIDTMFQYWFKSGLMSTPHGHTSDDMVDVSRQDLIEATEKAVSIVLQSNDIIVGSKMTSLGSVERLLCEYVFMHIGDTMAQLGLLDTQVVGEAAFVEIKTHPDLLTSAEDVIQAALDASYTESIKRNMSEEAMTTFAKLIRRYGRADVSAGRRHVISPRQMKELFRSSYARYAERYVPVQDILTPKFKDIIAICAIANGPTRLIESLSHSVHDTISRLIESESIQELLKYKNFQDWADQVNVNAELIRALTHRNFSSDRIEKAADLLLRILTTENQYLTRLDIKDLGNAISHRLHTVEDRDRLVCHIEYQTRYSRKAVPQVFIKGETKTGGFENVFSLYDHHDYPSSYLGNLMSSVETASRDIIMNLARLNTKTRSLLIHSMTTNAVMVKSKKVADDINHSSNDFISYSFTGSPALLTLVAGVEAPRGVIRSTYKDGTAVKECILYGLGSEEEMAKKHYDFNFSKFIIEGVVYTDDARIVLAITRDRDIFAPEADDVIPTRLTIIESSVKARFYSSVSNLDSLRFSEVTIPAFMPDTVKDVRVRAKSLIVDKLALFSEDPVEKGARNALVSHGHGLVHNELVTFYNQLQFLKANKVLQTEGVNRKLNGYFAEFLHSIGELGRIREIIIGTYAEIDSDLTFDTPLGSKSTKYHITTEDAVTGIPTLLFALFRQMVMTFTVEAGKQETDVKDVLDYIAASLVADVTERVRLRASESILDDVLEHKTLGEKVSAILDSKNMYKSL